jgi:hypothetical protein
MNGNWPLASLSSTVISPVWSSVSMPAMSPFGLPAFW